MKALAAMPDETVIDGEIVALDDSGKPSFNALQNYGSSRTPILYYVFDVLVIAGRDVMPEPLQRRRELLQARQFAFVEWTQDGHLWHARLVALREDKNAREVGRT